MGRVASNSQDEFIQLIQQKILLIAFNVEWDIYAATFWPIAYAMPAMHRRTAIKLYCWWAHIWLVGKRGMRQNWVNRTCMDLQTCAASLRKYIYKIYISQKTIRDGHLKVCHIRIQRIVSTIARKHCTCGKRTPKWFCSTWRRFSSAKCHEWQR